MVHWLNVRFEEKDQAKALGARWSPDEKKWFVPDGVDPAHFEAWLPTPPEPLKSVPPTPYILSDGIGPQVGTQTVALEILDGDCWKCQKSIGMVSGVVLPASVETIIDWTSWEPRYYLALPLDCLSDQRTVSEAVELLRQKPDHRDLSPVGNVTFSAGTYFACSCPLCGAGQGSFPMGERRMDKLVNGELQPGTIQGIRHEPAIMTITRNDLTYPGLESSPWVVSFPDDRVYVDPEEQDDPRIRPAPKPSAFFGLRDKLMGIFEKTNPKA